jgi:hypothetical protein
VDTVQLTWWRVVRFWWAAAWRSVIWGNLFAGVIALILGLILALLGHRRLDNEAANLFLDAIALGWIPGFIFAMRSALRLPYKDFRIVLISPEPKL